jgi:voltage-gated sodium channel
MHTITRVLLKSFVSLNKVLALLLLFIYIFSVIGVLLFKLPDERTMTENERITFQYFKTRAKSYANKNMEPFGSISESMFTLFRIITGDNWTTYRYQLVFASKKNLISTPSWIITSYFILWMILGAYLLLNLILGAILHNYEVFFKEMRSEREIAREKEIDNKVTILLDSIKTSLTDSKLSEQEKREIINKAIEIMKRKP